MISYFGDFAEDATVRIPFNTFSSNDPTASVTITNLADADIKVHKDGDLTQIVTDGATVIINYDSITGNHLITIDTSVDADYTAGAEYQVRIEGTTVDGGTINAWVASFSIERVGGVLALIKAGNLSANVVQLGGSTQSATDLKDFADDGYDPATNKVTGVVLTDLVTANTDMRGTDSALTDKAGVSRAATGLDAIASTATGAVALAKAVWDLVLTGATHNIVNSAARILRFLRSAGTYTDGLVWLDLTNGFTGTDDFENGTEVRPAKTLAEALTLLGSASMGLH